MRWDSRWTKGSAERSEDGGSVEGRNAVSDAYNTRCVSGLLVDVTSYTVLLK